MLLCFCDHWRGISLVPAADCGCCLHIESASGNELLAAFCLQELVLDVEYLLAVLSPKTEHELPHDDWCGLRAALQCMERRDVRAVLVDQRISMGCRVSCLDGRNGDTIVSGSYDGVVRIWSGAAFDNSRCATWALPRRTSCAYCSTTHTHQMCAQGRRPLAASRHTADELQR